jgi:hypothetical protein
VAVKPSPGVLSVPISVHEALPARLRSKTTCAVSADVVTPSVALPEIPAPGSFTETTGARLSTLTVRVPEVVSLPATSVMTTRSSAGPSA